MKKIFRSLGIGGIKNRKDYAEYIQKSGGGYLEEGIRQHRT